MIEAFYASVERLHGKEIADYWRNTPVEPDNSECREPINDEWNENEVD